MAFRRKQIRSPEDEDKFLSMVQDLHFEICSLERQNGQLTERPQVDQQLARVGRTGHPSGNDNNGPTPDQHPSRTRQFQAALAGCEAIPVTDSLYNLADQVLAAIATYQSAEHLLNTLSRMGQTPESRASEEVEAGAEVVAEGREAEVVTVQEGLNDAGTQSDAGQDTKGGLCGNIVGFFADLWNCAWK